MQLPEAKAGSHECTIWTLFKPTKITTYSLSRTDLKNLQAPTAQPVRKAADPILVAPVAPTAPAAPIAPTVAVVAAIGAPATNAAPQPANRAAFFRHLRDSGEMPLIFSPLATCSMRSGCSPNSRSITNISAKGNLRAASSMPLRSPRSFHSSRQRSIVC